MTWIRILWPIFAELGSSFFLSLFLLSLERTSFSSYTYREKKITYTAVPIGLTDLREFRGIERDDWKSRPRNYRGFLSEPTDRSPYMRENEPYYIHTRNRSEIGATVKSSAYIYTYTVWRKRPKTAVYVCVECRFRSVCIIYSFRTSYNDTDFERGIAGIHAVCIMEFKLKEKPPGFYASKMAGYLAYIDCAGSFRQKIGGIKNRIYIHM